MQVSDNSTADLHQIKMKAESHLMYKIGIGTHMYYTPIIVILGLCGNLSSLLVLLNKKNRKNSCYILMASLEASDSVLLGIAGYHWFR